MKGHRNRGDLEDLRLLGLVNKLNLGVIKAIWYWSQGRGETRSSVTTSLLCYAWPGPGLALKVWGCQDCAPVPNPPTPYLTLRSPHFLMALIYPSIKARDQTAWPRKQEIMGKTRTTSAPGERQGPVWEATNTAFSPRSIEALDIYF